jgi:lactate 2-monooxygenase
MLTIGKSRQAKIYLDGFLGKNPSISQIYSELEKEAKRKLSKDAFGYLSCGAGTNQGCLNNI